jgi:hypothetical protein
VREGTESGGGDTKACAFSGSRGRCGGRHKTVSTLFYRGSHLIMKWLKCHFQFIVIVTWMGAWSSLLAGKRSNLLCFVFLRFGRSAEFRISRFVFLMDESRFLFLMDESRSDNCFCAAETGKTLNPHRPQGSLIILSFLSHLAWKTLFLPACQS